MPRHDAVEARARFFGGYREFLRKIAGHDPKVYRRRLQLFASDGATGCGPKSRSEIIRMAPTVTAESATLKVGQGLKMCQGRKCNHTSRKSVTAPWTMRSVTFPVAPASTSARPAALSEFR